MRTISRFGALLGVVGILALGGCATMNQPSNAPAQPTGSINAGNARPGVGVVQAIELVQQGNAGDGVGAGAIAGAVVGGVLGNQVGRGSGRTLATIGGAAAGAYAGHELEKNQQRTSDLYRFTIRMNNGAIQTLTHNSAAGFRVGDRVRIENGYMHRR